METEQFTLAVEGLHFDSTTIEVLFNGPGCSPCVVPNDVLTTKSATQVTGPATLDTAGTYTVSVRNGGIGTTSNGLPIVITPRPATVTVQATFNGEPWSGAVTFALVGPSGSVEGSAVPFNLSGQQPGSYSLQFTSGGPVGAYLLGIVPAEEQVLSTGGALTFSLRFATASLVHQDPDPNVYYGTPLVEASGALYLPRVLSSASCNFGICQIALEKAGGGNGGWVTGSLGADSFSSLKLAFGVEGSVYFQGGQRSTVAAFRPDLGAREK